MVDEQETPVTAERKGKEGVADTLALVSYSLIAGATTDYASGLRGLGIVASRAYGTAINVPTGAAYGKWRNFLYRKTKTTDKSSKLRKGAVECLAFGTFQVPLYATVIAFGSLASHLTQGEVKVDLDKIGKGAAILTCISPLIGPTMGLWSEGVRKLFDLKSAPRKARDSLEQKLGHPDKPKP